MIDPRSRSGRTDPEIQSVQAVPSDLRILVRVTGRWHRAPNLPANPVLLVDDDGERRRIEALPAAAAPGEDPDVRRLRAVFSLPLELERQLAGGLTLEVGSIAVGLPPATFGGEGEEQEERGTVVDPGVLAERRARRAELAERDQARRATEAEQTLGALGTEIERLQRRLEEASGERSGLEGQLAERERELRAVRQRAYAEQRLREEALEERAREGTATEDEVAELRRRVERAVLDSERLRAELEATRRRAAEAEHQIAAASAGRRRAERRVAEEEQRLAQREADLRRRIEGAGEDDQGVVGARAGVVQAGEAGEAVRIDTERMRDEAAAARAAHARPVDSGAEVSPHREPPELDRELLAGERRLLAHGPAPGAAPPAGMDAGGSPGGARVVADAERRIAEARDAVALVQRRLDGERAELERERDGLERRIAELEDRAAAAHEARRTAEVELDRLREQSTSERARLEAELRDREEMHARVEESLHAVRAELAAVQAEARTQAAARVEAERAKAQLEASTRQVRSQLELFEAERRMAADQAGQAREALEHQQAEVDGLRQAALEQSRALEQAEGRTHREAAERRSLESRIASERAELRHRLEALEAELRAEAAQERAALERHVSGLESQLLALRDDSKTAGDELRTERDRTGVLEAELAERTAIQERVEGALEALRAQLGAVAEEAQGRSTVAEETVLELIGAATSALQEAEERIQRVQEAAAEAERTLVDERAQRETIERELHAQMAAERMDFDRRLRAVRSRAPAEQADPTERAAEEVDEADEALPTHDRGVSRPQAETTELPALELSAETRVQELLDGLRSTLGAWEERDRAEWPHLPGEPPPADFGPPPEPEPRPEPESGHETPPERAPEPEMPLELTSEPEAPEPETPPEPEPEPVSAETELPDPGTAAPAIVQPPTVQPGAKAIELPRYAGPWVASALSDLAAEDAIAAARAAVAFAPVQAYALGRTFDVDVVLVGAGTWALAAGTDGVSAVPLDGPRPFGEAEAVIEAEPGDFVALTGGEGRRFGRGPRVEVAGSRRVARRLRDLSAAPAGLADIVRAGIELDPMLAFRLLAHAIPPELTRGQRFTIALDRTDGEVEARRYLHVRDGERIEVSSDGGPELPRARVQASAETFLLLLGGSAPRTGQKASIRGDAHAVGLLQRWSELVQGLA